MESTTTYEISRLNLQELVTPASASITNVKHLSSYNWIEASDATPTIAVPGSPALWSAPSVSRRLKKDSGLIYVAQNAARHPESPLEPLFRAIYTTYPSFDIRSTDVVTDRNNIRKLFSFIDPSSSKGGLEAFTMNIEVKKDTAIFCRTETKTVEHIGPQEFRGFGHEFEKAYTTTQINGSTGHHRIVSYRFGDLTFIVRHETDGYVGTDTKSSSIATDHAGESISSMLGALSLSPTNISPSIIPAGSKLIIRKEGWEVPLASTLEIKTRVFHKPLDIKEVATQLWISQTPKLVRAYHQSGTFKSPVVEDVANEIKSWEEHKQNDLKKLAALIRKIINLVKECGGKAVLKYNVEGDKLVICKAEMNEMLPKDLYAKWDDRHDYEVENDSQKDDAQGTKVAQIMPENTSTIRTMSDDLETIIRVGDVDYSVQVSKIPYLASFVQLQQAASPEATEFIHKPIQLFDVALKGVQLGYRQCFRSLSTNLSQYRTLFKTYKFLDVDVLSGLSMDEVIANLRVGKADYDPDETRPIPGNKRLARDTALQLLYLILHAQSGDEKKDGMKIFNAVLFVLSHPGTFKPRTKRVIRLAYEERFWPTIKQKARLNQWDKSEAADSATDATTEEDADYCSDTHHYSL